MKKQGLGLVAISYDSQQVLAAFAQKYGITFPLLSDVGSQVIERYGILNTEATGVAKGIAYPGIFVAN